MNKKFRCNCPITSSLDILGDKWTLVIIKHMLIEGKQTFKDFLESDEAIATNILSSRLKMLEELKIITKDKKELDLLDQKNVMNFFKQEKIDQIYFAAAKVGGIYSNNTYPAEFIYKNLTIQANIIHSAFLSGVKSGVLN